MKKTNKQKIKKPQNTKENKTNTTRCACSRELHRQILFFSKHSSQPTILAPFLLSLRPASCMAKQRSTYSNKKNIPPQVSPQLFFFDRSAPVLRIFTEKATRRTFERKSLWGSRRTKIKQVQNHNKTSRCEPDQNYVFHDKMMERSALRTKQTSLAHEATN